MRQCRDEAMALVILQAGCCPYGQVPQVGAGEVDLDGLGLVKDLAVAAENDDIVPCLGTLVLDVKFLVQDAAVDDLFHDVEASLPVECNLPVPIDMRAYLAQRKEAIAFVANAHGLDRRTLNVLPKDSADVPSRGTLGVLEMVLNDPGSMVRGTI